MLVSHNVKHSGNKAWRPERFVVCEVWSRCLLLTADYPSIMPKNLTLQRDGFPIVSFNSVCPSSLVAKDNLTKIKGIGPVINAQLLKLGYVSYEQIAELDDERIKTLRGQLKHEQDIHKQDWMGQARKLIKQRDSLK